MSTGRAFLLSYFVIGLVTVQIVLFSTLQVPAFEMEELICNFKGFAFAFCISFLNCIMLQRSLGRNRKCRHTSKFTQCKYYCFIFDEEIK